MTSLPQLVADVIGEHAGGNPFFSEELAYALRDTGVITVTNGTCRIAPGADLQALSLPDTVQGVVLTRIDRLAPPQQLTLKVASVIGRSFAYRLLHDIHPIAADRPTLPGQLEGLQRRSLVLLEAPEPELAWMFKHVITRDVAYELMLRASGGRCTARSPNGTSGTIRRSYPGSTPLLAYHWSRTERGRQGRPLPGAGRRAGAGGWRLPGGHAFLAAALARDPPPAQEDSAEARFRRARWERQLAEAHLGLGGTGEGRVHLSRALELLGSAPARHTSPARRQRAATARPPGVPPCLPGQGRGPGAAAAARTCLEASRAYIRLTEVFWFANDVPPLVHAGIRALNLAERAGPSPELARAYSIMCLAAGSIPIHPLARAYARRAEQTARHTGQLWPLAYVRFITCVYNIGAARWAEVQEALEEAEGLFERLGDRRALGDTLTVQGMLVALPRPVRRAGGRVRRLYQRGRRDENVQHQVWACSGKAECELRAGRPDEAARLLEAALALLTDHPDQAERLRAYGLLAVVRLRRGRARQRSRLPKRPPASSPSSRRRRPSTCSRAMPGSPRSTCPVGDRRRRLATPGGPPGRPAGPSHVRPRLPNRQAAGPALRAAFPAIRTAERARAAWRASLAAAQRLGMPFEAALAHSNSAGLLLVSCSDSGTWSKRRSCWANSESSIFPHSNHLRSRHLAPGTATLRVLQGRVRLVTAKQAGSWVRAATFNYRPADTGWRAWRTPPSS